MPSLEHYRRLEAMYAAAPTNRYYRPRIQVGPGTAEVWVQVRPEFHHAAGAVHGAVIFKLCDDAAFFAANSQVDDVFVLTASYQIDLVRPVAEGVLYAVGRLVHPGRTRLLAEAEVHTEAGKLVARGRGSFLRSGIPLTSAAGYK
jgi:uncharacterized protein (TIGR00369 family)